MKAGNWRALTDETNESGMHVWSGFLEKDCRQPSGQRLYVGDKSGQEGAREEEKDRVLAGQKEEVRCFQSRCIKHGPILALV